MSGVVVREILRRKARSALIERKTHMRTGHYQGMKREGREGEEREALHAREGSRKKKKGNRITNSAASAFVHCCVTSSSITYLIVLYEWLQVC